MTGSCWPQPVVGGGAVPLPLPSAGGREVAVEVDPSWPSGYDEVRLEIDVEGKRRVVGAATLRSRGGAP